MMMNGDGGGDGDDNNGVGNCTGRSSEYPANL